MTESTLLGRIPPQAVSEEIIEFRTPDFWGTEMNAT
jgi:hypothetical protein